MLGDGTCPEFEGERDQYNIRLNFATVHCLSNYLWLLSHSIELLFASTKVELPKAQY